MEGYGGSSGDRRVRVKICGITNGEDALRAMRFVEAAYASSASGRLEPLNDKAGGS